MSVTPRIRVVAATPPELVVYDEPGPCSYLPEQCWRLPLRLPVRTLTPDELGRRLNDGDRRQGRLLYRTACPACRACQPIRIEVERFVPSRTQRRVERRGDRLIRVELGPCQVDPDRVHLYNLHKHARELSVGERFTSTEAYRSFLSDSCCQTFEMSYRLGDELLGAAVVDQADDALSAVYFFWDPARAALSPGVYSVLKQIELCRQLNLRFLYLGLYVAECRAMAYKSGYLPHERLIDGRWTRFDRPCPVGSRRAR